MIHHALFSPAWSQGEGVPPQNIRVWQHSPVELWFAPQQPVTANTMHDAVGRDGRRAGTVCKAFTSFSMASGGQLPRERESNIQVKVPLAPRRAKGRHRCARRANHRPRLLSQTDTPRPHHRSPTTVPLLCASPCFMSLRLSYLTDGLTMLQERSARANNIGKLVHTLDYQLPTRQLPV
jgi:hypothetical protein